MRFAWFAVFSFLISGAACTSAHSKVALNPDLDRVPPPGSTFVSEEDSGLAFLGMLQVSEPDHYAVLVARAKKRFRCARLSQVQLDYYTDHWVLVAFPIARITAICEPELMPSGEPIHVDTSTISR